MSRLPLDNNPVYAASTDVVSLYRGDEWLGDVGLIWTSLIGAEGFLWYVPGARPLVHELIEMRMLLEAWSTLKGARIWMVIKKDDPKLSRWARFMGFVEAEPYDDGHIRCWRP